MKNLNKFYQIIIEELKKNNETLKLNDLKGKTVIFIVDMVNGFCKEGTLAAQEINEIVPAIQNLIKKAINKNIEIFALNDAHNENSPEFKNYPPHCLENTLESKLISDLDFQEIKVLNKNSTNGFFVTDTKKIADWDNIIVTGCWTDVCVYQFALSCKTWCNQKNKNINVIVPKIMTTTIDTNEHPKEIINNLSWHSMLKNGITIVREII